MSHESSLSTRLDAPCQACTGNYRLVEPTDALAARPVAVNVRCPDCGHAATVILFEGNVARRRPQSGFATTAQPPQVRYSGAAATGVNLTLRYSLRPDEAQGDAEDGEQPNPRSA